MAWPIAIPLTALVIAMIAFIKWRSDPTVFRAIFIAWCGMSTVLSVIGAAVMYETKNLDGEPHVLLFVGILMMIPSLFSLFSMD